MRLNFHICSYDCPECSIMVLKYSAQNRIYVELMIKFQKNVNIKIAEGIKTRFILEKHIIFIILQIKRKSNTRR